VKARFDAGTDIAMIGAWEADRGVQPFTGPERQQLAETLEAEAAQGHLCVIHTRADGAGPVVAYIDEDIPAELRERLTQLGDENLLAIPSGKLVVDGVEYYRGKNATAARPDSTAAVQPGDYGVRCYEVKATEEAPRSQEELEALVGKGELRYFERVNQRGCFGGALTLFLFPILLAFVGWKIAFSITVVGFLGYFNVRERVLKRSARFSRLSDTIVRYRLEHEEPAFVLEMHLKR
jgi:hypothetical protein